MTNIDPWGKVDLRAWQSLPVTTDRLATEADVESGRAVFFVPIGDEYNPSTPFAIKLPRPAVVAASGSPVFIIQAETVDGKTAAGCRPIEGGNCIFLIDELEVLEIPDERFSADD